MTSQTCPSCGEPATGRFCSHCGTAVAAAPHACAACGSELPPGGRFCTECGAAADAPLSAASPSNAPDANPAGRRTRLPWAITAGVLALLLAMVLWPRFRGGEADGRIPGGPPITGTAAAPAGGGVDLSSMSPREAADRLFNRVMQAVANGDSAQARQFLPMALAAYDRVPDLDRDGRYHLAVLHLVDGNPEAARTHADRILEEEPNHLFGLATAAQAEMARGNERSARDLYRRFLENYESEIARGLPEYREHEPVLPAMRQEAEQVLGASR